VWYGTTQFLWTGLFSRLCLSNLTLYFEWRCDSRCSLVIYWHFRSVAAGFIVVALRLNQASLLTYCTRSAELSTGNPKDTHGYVCNAWVRKRAGMQVWNGKEALAANSTLTLTVFGIYSEFVRILWLCYVTYNTFKNRLDTFWSDQDILYDYKADLHGIGNRSVVY